VRFIVAQTAGGNADLVARSYGQRLSERLGQQFVIDNRPGAGGVIGAELVVRAQPDGYTLLLAPTSYGINPSLIAKIPFNSKRDLAPISLLGKSPNMLVVNPQIAVRTVSDLINMARARPGKMHFSSSGIASSNHLAGELFKLMAGVDIVHVAYKGGPAAMVAVVSGESEFSFASLPTSVGLAKAGKLRAVAVTSSTRWPPLPEIPTIAESGVPGFENSVWQAMLAPAKTPPPILDLLTRHVMEVARVPEFRARMMVEGSEPQGTDAKTLARFIEDEIEKWHKVTKAAGLKPQ
jgi:tripartite-type tricarboxylate transporter receptor subunit TctC